MYLMTRLNNGQGHERKPNIKPIMEKKWLIIYVLIIMREDYERQILNLGLQTEVNAHRGMWKLEFHHWNFSLLLLF